MPKQSAPLPPDDPPQPQPSGPGSAPVKGPPERPVAAPVRDSVRPAAQQKRPGRRWDRYDYIGAAIVAFLVALWAVHFSLPTLPPDNVPDASQPIGRN